MPWERASQSLPQPIGAEWVDEEGDTRCEANAANGERCTVQRHGVQPRAGPH